MGKHGQDGISMIATHDVQGSIRLQRSHPLETVVRITFVNAHDDFTYDDIIWQVLFGGREFTEIVYGSLPVVPADSKLGPRQNAPAIGVSPRALKPGEKIELWLEYPEDRWMAPGSGSEKWVFVVPEVGEESICNRID